MRILVFNPSYPPVPCGVGDYVRGLASALTRAGHEVTVVTMAPVTPAAKGPPRVLPLLRSWGVREFLRTCRRVGRPRPDLVVSGFPAVLAGDRAGLFYVLPGLAKLAFGRPLTTFILHEFVRTGELERRLLALPLWTADRIVTVTGAERDAVVDRYPSVAGRIAVRQNAPSIPVTVTDEAADAMARASLTPGDRRVVAYFGLLSAPEKGFDDLLDAVAVTGALLVASGSLDPSQPYHAEVAARIEQLGLADRVRWLGFVADDDVGRLLRAADAVALPYRLGAESGYTSLLAALTNGAAVITTRGRQTPEWLRDGETALLVDPCDPAALAGALRRLEAEPELAARLRAGAARLSFGWDEIVEAVVGGSRRRLVPTGRGLRSGRRLVQRKER